MSFREALLAGCIPSISKRKPFIALQLCCLHCFYAIENDAFQACLSYVHFITDFAFASNCLKLALDCDQKFASFSLQFPVFITCQMKLNLCRRQKTGSSKQFSCLDCFLDAVCAHTIQPLGRSSIFFFFFTLLVCQQNYHFELQVKDRILIIFNPCGLLKGNCFDS